MFSQVKRFKGLRAGLRSVVEAPTVKWKLGEWVERELDPFYGLTCSKNVQDVFSSERRVEFIAEVEVRGDHVEKGYEEKWERMRILRAWRWTRKDSVELAIFCAELVLDFWTQEYPTDNRPQKALLAAINCLSCPTEENLKADERAEGEARDAAYWALKAAKFKEHDAACATACAARAARELYPEEAAWWAGAAIASVGWRAEDKTLVENWLRQRIKFLIPYNGDGDFE